MYRVLIADDEMVIRQGLVSGNPWEEWGFEVIGAAKDGLEAIELIEQEHPDVVLSDIRMPKCDGIEVMEYINANHPEIKIIILSGYNDFEYLNKSIKNNVTDYLLKPTDEEEFYELFMKVKRELDEENEKNAYVKELETVRNTDIIDRFLKRYIGTGEIEEGMLPTKGYVTVWEADNKLSVKEYDTVMEALVKNEAVLFYRDVTGRVVGITETYPETFFKNALETWPQLNGGVSAVCESLQRYQEGYEEALHALEQRRFLNSQQWIDFKSVKVAESESPLMREVLKIIDEEFANNMMALEYVAEKVGKSTSYISKLFKNETGYNFAAYVTKKRMEEAEKLLMDYSIKAYDIAVRVGYADASIFSKAFRKTHGMSPGDFRTFRGGDRK